MKDRIYLDYNATSPLSKRSIEILDKGDFLFVNPSSSHSSGKSARKLLNLANNYIKNIFNCPSDFELIFHSGATEALNTFFNLSSQDIMIYSESDHPAVEALARKNKENGCEVYCLNQSPFFDFESFEKILESSQKEIFLNFTWVNNETGLINDLKRIVALKSKYNFYIHVDAVQSVGKFIGWDKLLDGIDIYSYSAHKFGALKGIGFSFLKNDFPWKPLIIGGGQQGDKRAGTENITGVLSIQGALEDLSRDLNIEKSLELRNKIIKLLKDSFKDEVIILLENDNDVACNTIGFIHKKKKSDIMLMQFDLSGVDVSFGSACSSGSFIQTQSLRSFSLSQYEKSFIRISFGPKDYENEKILTRLKLVFDKLK